MQTVIKRPKVGQYLHKDDVKIEVLEVWGFYDCLQYDSEAERRIVYDQLKDQLGDNYRDLYYEVYGRVLRGKPDMHKRWQHIVLDWREVQDYAIV